MKKEKILSADIKKLAAARGALILAHNYQRPEVQLIADHTGDSYGLSVIAARAKEPVVVFCGVHFMAESAAILAPQKIVLLPRLDAACPLADTISPDQLETLRREHPGVPVVSYVNTTARIKALSDYCCTSANALRIVESIAADEVIFVPDRNLAAWVAAHSGKRIIPWHGVCPVHHQVTEEDIILAKAARPQAAFICHPECRPEVWKLADKVASTSAFYDYCAASHADAFIIGTEEGVIPRLRRENPYKEFETPRPMICPNMKLTTLEDVLECLEKMNKVVTVPQKIAQQAVHALERMVAVVG